MAYFFEDLFLYIGRGARSVPGRKFALIIIALLLLPMLSFAGGGDDDPGDEISVSLEVRGVGSADISAIYRDKDVYLLIPAVFDLIKVRNVVSSSYDSVTGFFMNEADVYVMDRPNHRIIYQGKTFDVQQGFIRTETGLYLDLKYFKTVFGLDGTFYFRRLVVTMSSEAELPAAREARQELMRRNLGRLKGDAPADTTYGRTHPFFHFGMADWAVMSSQQSPGADQTTVNLGLGAVVAGGELNTSLNYYSQQAFTEKLQYYQWRYVNNDNQALRQVAAGKIFAQATSTLYAPVVGVQLTNAPTTYRKSYGTYTLSNTTEPNWLVELYVNDVLVDYKRADASGFYSFEVPLIYGFTIIKLRFYGPYGEERTSQQYINIPFNFLPQHEFEYSASAGIVEDNTSSRFSRVNLNYGLSRIMTIGGGLEYLSSVTSGAYMPFLNTSLRLTPHLLLSGEYTYGVRSRGVASYRLPIGLQVDIDYTKYDKGQTAIYYNYLEERKAVVTLPIHTQNISLFSRITVDQILVPNTQYTNLEWTITGFIKRVGVNVSTYSSVVDNALPYLYSIASLTVPLPKRFIFTTQWQYDYKEAKPIFMKHTLEKRVFTKGYLSLAYQDFFNVNNYNFLVGLRYDFSVTRAAVSILAGNNNTYSRVEAASGSLIADAGSHYLNFNNHSNVGRSAIVIEPFLDINNNGVHDEGEPRVPGLKIKVNGGRVVYDDVRDTCIRIFDLEPYYNYYIELDRNSFDNIAWQIKNKTINVAANPDNFTRIEVPVVVAGEISGTVSLKGKEGRNAKGQGQIVLDVYSGPSIAAHVVTEGDGFFNFLGLLPGAYVVKVDSAQLNRLHLRARPDSLPLTIKVSRDGDVADGLDFTLLPPGVEMTDTAKPVQPHIPADTASSVTDGKHGVEITDAVKHRRRREVRDTTETFSKRSVAQRTDTAGQVIAESGSYGILIDVYDNIGRAGVVKTRLIRMFRQPVTIMQVRADYEVMIVGFARRRDAEALLPELEKKGYSDALIVRLKDKVVK